MTSLTKNTTNSSFANTSSLGRLLFIAAATVLAMVAASLWAFEGRASSRRPLVNIIASTSIVNICPGEEARARVRLRAEGVGPTCTARYKWRPTGGRIVGEGPNVVWDFSGVQKLDSYDVTLTLEGGEACGVRRAVSLPTRVVVWHCPPRVNVIGSSVPVPRPTAACPSISLCCHAASTHGLLEPFRATLSGGAYGVTPQFKWTLSDGEVASGQGTDSILVDANGARGRTILATLEVGGYGARCSATCATKVPDPPTYDPTPKPSPHPLPSPYPSPSPKPSPSPRHPYDPTPTPYPTPSPHPSPSPKPSPSPSPSPVTNPVPEYSPSPISTATPTATPIFNPYPPQSICMCCWLLIVLLILALCLAAYFWWKSKKASGRYKP